MSISVDVQISDNINKLISLDKQILFATAKSLTQVARDCQKEVIANINEDLTVRSEWYLPSRAFGIKITKKLATKTDLSVEISSKADWLVATEQGREHVPSGGRESIAVPTAAVRPTGREIIRRPLRPTRLKKAFIVTDRSGRRMLFQRVGPRPQDLKLMYFLDPKTRRPKKQPFTRGVREGFTKNYGALFHDNLIRAVQSARVES